MSESARMDQLSPRRARHQRGKKRGNRRPRGHELYRYAGDVLSEEGEEEFTSLLGETGKAREQWDKSRTGSAGFLRDTLCCLPFSCLCARYSHPVLDYEKFLSQVKTGDLFLFEGKGAWSWAIQCVTQMRYSHMAVAIKLVNPKEPERPYFMLWESTQKDETYDFITRTDKDGLRLVSMHEKLYEYANANYSVSYRPIRVHEEGVRKRINDGKAGTKAWELILRGAHIPYETDYIELANAHKRWVVGERGHAGEHNRDSVFCSEAVMWFYRDAMGLSLEDEENGITWVPEDFTPADFAQESEGIPFAYSDPPRATFGGQYEVASRGSIDDGLVRRYQAFLRTKDAMASKFNAMIAKGVKVVESERTDPVTRTIHLNEDVLWRVDFGSNKHPSVDDEGMARVPLEEYP